MFLGIYDIDDYVSIPAATHRFSSGAAYAPTSITYSIYEEGETTGRDENVDMTPASPHDSITGVYIARRQLTAAAGFERGKTYLVVVKATVDSVAANELHLFQIKYTQTGDSFARLGAPAGASHAADLVVIDNFVDDLESRLTAARAGYLDNLSAGAAALEATAQSILTDTGTTLDGKLNTIDDFLDSEVASILAAVDTEVAALVTELAKVPKSDGVVSWNATALGAIKTALEAAGSSLASILDDTGTAGVVVAAASKTGYALGTGGVPADGFAANAITAAATAADFGTEVANAVKAAVIEAQGSYTIQQALSIILSVLAGVTAASGATIKTPNGAADRVAATINASQERTAMTLTPSA